jgi:hypothetical protein
VRQIRRQMHGEEEEEAGKFTGGLERRDRHRRRRSGRRLRRRAVKTAAARRSRPNLSSRARFGARTGSTRRGERAELTQGLREVARVTAAAPRRSWRAAQGRRVTGGAATRFARNKREDEVPHLAAMLRVKRTEVSHPFSEENQMHLIRVL